MNPRSLRLELAPSPGLAVVLVVLHAAAALCLLAVLPRLAGSVAALLVLGSGLWSAWSRALLRSGSSLRTIHVTGEAMEIGLASGQVLQVEALARRYVGRMLVLMPLRRPMRRTILVTADMLPSESFRQLRVWALWGKLPPVAGTQLRA